MSEVVIQAEKLTKSYNIQHASAWGKRSATGATLSELLHSAALGWLKKKDNTEKASSEEFFALRDVSFEIMDGEAVGIIGRNGAGKSTLLKILSRITEPSSGSARVNGRVASLLEVGSGFHPELSGRENIFLNGSILGMTRAEIRSKLDEIVAFSGVEKFLDTPVKRYSSGMYVRLAFAVAAHLEPEILVVDEVLAVGDAEFQRKCLGKMEGVAKSGRTVIFVSHSMAAVRNLTTRCLFLDQGRLAFSGNTDEAIERYLGANSEVDDRQLASHRPKWASPLIQSVRLLNLDGESCINVPLGGGFIVEMKFQSEAPLVSPNMGLVLQHPFIGIVASVNMWRTAYEPPGNGPWHTATMRCHVPDTALLQGSYTIDVWLADAGKDLDVIQGYLRLHIEEADIYQSGRPPVANYGVTFLKPHWTFDS